MEEIELKMLRVTGNEGGFKFYGVTRSALLIKLVLEGLVF